ncbi:MAG: enoyl-CoA hydratase-related protein [Desulfobacteraceae bacterium]|nr:enoyl-CoA hydratase-related protein [Desulfobacteraceae bacterium]
MGGAFDLAALCAIRICSGAAAFGHPEIKFGAPPLFTPLRWIVGDGHARYLCLTGATIDAKEAHRIGLVNEIVTNQSVLERAKILAAQIGQAPDPTLFTLKQYLMGNHGKGFEDCFAEEHDAPFKSLLQKGRFPT